jgi:glutamate/tyrosine decarboxylase-like PLP-dependent enzyme
MSTVPTHLDPEDWDSFRAGAHRMLDDMIDFVAAIRSRPVWQKMPVEIRSELRGKLPEGPVPLEQVHRDFMERVLPFSVGNAHPGFMGWVHGGGTVQGMMAELAAAGLNANLGGRDHAPIELERQVLRWAAEAIGLPAESAGLLVTGTSIANLAALLVARTRHLGPEVRREGLEGRRLVAYASDAAHGCVAKAMDMAGIGSDNLHLVPSDENGRMDLSHLAERLRTDRARGAEPFMVVGTAGTVNCGAIDDLAGLAAFCRAERLWFHIDGAIGALAGISPALKPLFAGIEQADSIAFDFHKWLQIPYDCGGFLVRDAQLLHQTFATDNVYLRRETRGLAGGDLPWPCDLGPDLSRGFRALKVWYSLRVFGRERLAAVMENHCRLAQSLAARIAAEPRLEMMAPVALNIVCFRYRFENDADREMVELAADLQESGEAVVSTTRIKGQVVLRAAIFNHRAEERDLDRLISAVLRLGAVRG